VNDAASIYVLGNFYHYGVNGLQQDHVKAIEQYARAADLGYSQAHYSLGDIYRQGGDMKKAKFHFEAAAMGGHEVARMALGLMECHCGNMERAVKHWTIAVSAGCYLSMHHLRTSFEEGAISRDAINLTLKAYNNACAEMRSDARDAYIRNYMVNN
jgi:TPR repeat protein